MQDSFFCSSFTIPIYCCNVQPNSRRMKLGPRARLGGMKYGKKRGRIWRFREVVVIDRSKRPMTWSRRGDGSWCLVVPRLESMIFI